MKDIKEYVMRTLVELYKFRKDINHQRTVMLKYIDGKIEALTGVLEEIEDLEKKRNKDDERMV